MSAKCDETILSKIVCEVLFHLNKKTCTASKSANLAVFHFLDDPTLSTMKAAPQRADGSLDGPAHIIRARSTAPAVAETA